MQDLVIVGAGGSSREIAGAVAEINRLRPQWNLLGFVDDDPAKQGSLVDGLPILGTPAFLAGHQAQVIVGVARWRTAGIRREIVERLNLPAARYATVIHPSASVSSHATVGRGTAILQNVVITAGTTIGNHVVISQNVTMGHDQVVEDFVTIGAGAIIAGFAKLRSCSYVGAGAIVNTDVTVNEDALVGVGSVALRNVPAGRTVFGNPAQVLPELRRH
jgi:sugar O-acyltransferase (sialic acid O-acetyltransferase NeuD family)